MLSVKICDWISTRFIGPNAYVWCFTRRNLCCAALVLCLLALPGRHSETEPCWEPHSACWTGHTSPLPALAAAGAVAASASAGGKRSFYSVLMSQPLQGEEKEPVLGDGGITSSDSLWVSEQTCLSELCRASPDECCKRWCSTKLWNKEQAGNKYDGSSVPLSISWMWGTCQLEDLKRKQRRKWHKIV